MLGFNHLGVRRDFSALRSPRACSRLLKRCFSMLENGTQVSQICQGREI